MFRSATITLTLCLATFTAQAALQGRVPLTPGGTDYRAYYDTATNLTWVADANLAQTSGYDADGLMTWTAAVGWAASLNAGLGYLGVTNWRLPTVTDTGTSGCNWAYTGTDCGFNVDLSSEMARMYYSTLGNTGSYDTSGVPTGCAGAPNYCLTNTGPFSNLQPYYYWSGTEYAPNTNSTAWLFIFHDGVQGISTKSDAFYAWAVRPGDPLPVADDDGPIAVVEGIAQILPVGANDSNFTNPATVTATTLPTKGTITAISPPGPAAGMTITYTANIGAVGADSFVYDMTDSTPASDSATVTLDISLVNTVPGAFSFTDQTNVPLNTVSTSNAITVTGINVPTAISVVGGEYAINGGAFTTLAGTVSNGNTVSVRHTSSAAPETGVDTVLDVGGVTDTFTSTTLKYAFDDSATTAVNQPVQIDVLQNDFGMVATVFVGIWIDPLHGGVSVSGSPGPPSGIRITYTPTAGFAGTDSFEYWVESGPVVDYAVVAVNVVGDDVDGDGIYDINDNCTLVANVNQCDSDGDGYGNRCDGDLTGNSVTNSQDYVVFRTTLGGASIAPTYNVGDINCNGAVNSQDYVLFRQLLGSPPGPSGLVP